MKTTITLVRHGETNWNKKTLIQGHIDNPLNSNGKNQAILVCEKLKNYPKFDIIISSPLKRAYETASIINNYLHINSNIIIDSQLIERNFGELEGQLVGKESYEKIFSETANGLEKLLDLQNRSTTAILNISKKYEGKNIIITTHSHFIKGILSKVIEDFDFTTNLSNSSLTFLTVENENIIVNKYNV